MNVCARHECQTTAGCAHRGTNGQLCWFHEQSYTTVPGWLVERKLISEFTDDEIAREYYTRALRKLGDPRTRVSWEPSNSTARNPDPKSL